MKKIAIILFYIVSTIISIMSCKYFYSKGEFNGCLTTLKYFSQQQDNDYITEDMLKQICINIEEK